MYIVPFMNVKILERKKAINHESKRKEKYIKGLSRHNKCESCRCRQSIYIDFAIGRRHTTLL